MTSRRATWLERRQRQSRLVAVLGLLVIIGVGPADGRPRRARRHRPRGPVVRRRQRHRHRVEAREQALVERRHLVGEPVGHRHSDLPHPSARPGHEQLGRHRRSARQPARHPGRHALGRDQALRRLASLFVVAGSRLRGPALPVQLQRGSQDLHARLGLSGDDPQLPGRDHGDRQGHDRDALGDLDPEQPGSRQPHERLRQQLGDAVRPARAGHDRQHRRHLVGHPLPAGWPDRSHRRDVEQPERLEGLLRDARRWRCGHRLGQQQDRAPGPGRRRRPHQPQVGPVRRQRQGLRGDQDEPLVVVGAADHGSSSSILRREPGRTASRGASPTATPARSSSSTTSTTSRTSS